MVMGRFAKILAKVTDKFVLYLKVSHNKQKDLINY